MTPIPSATNEFENRYNIAHKKTRCLVERGIGILKSRFRCLSKQRILMYEPEKAGKIINTCAILHNFLICNGYPLPLISEIEEEMDDNDDENIIIEYPANEIYRAGLVERNTIVRNYFQNEI